MVRKYYKLELFKGPSEKIKNFKLYDKEMLFRLSY